jgi:hypothetical protein
MSMERIERMNNRKITCKQLKILSFLGLIMLIIFNGIIIKTTLAVLLRTTFELIVLIAVIVYFYCKKNREPKFK